MKTYKIDPVGQRFGRLVCISKGEKSKYGYYFFNCICDCGKSVSVLGSNLCAGRTKSCGCLQQETRRRTLGEGRGWTRRTPKDKWKPRVNKTTKERTVMYKVWYRLISRKEKVCDRWLVFENFLEDVGYKPEEADGRIVFDRIDKNGIYEFSNVRWIDFRASNYNTRLVSINK